MSNHIPETPVVGSQVEGQSPHSSEDWTNSSSSRGGVVMAEVNEAPIVTIDQEEPRVPETHIPREDHKNSLERDVPAVEESHEAMLERLGRQRPEVFRSIWSEIGFVFSISMAQVLTVRICLTSR